MCTIILYVYYTILVDSAIVVIVITLTLPPSFFLICGKNEENFDEKKHNIWWRSNNWEQLHPVALLAGCKGSFNKPLKHVDYCKNWTYHNVDIWTLKETLDFIACVANIERCPKFLHLKLQPKLSSAIVVTPLRVRLLSGCKTNF